MLKKEFDFVLQDQLIYSHEGRAGITAKKLFLRAPSTRFLSLASKLSAIVMSAFRKASESYKNSSQESKKAAPQTKDLDGSEIYMIISSSVDSIQMDEFTELLKELVLSDGICLVDGKEPLTGDLLDNLDSRETLRLFGDYVANFLLPSIMSSSKQKI